MIPNRFSKKIHTKNFQGFFLFFFPLPGLPCRTRKTRPTNEPIPLDPWPDLDPIQERRALFAPESPSRCPQGMGNPPAARKVMMGCLTFGEEQKTTWKRGEFYHFEPLCLKMFIIILFHSKSSSFLVPSTKDTKLWNVGDASSEKKQTAKFVPPTNPDEAPFRCRCACPSCKAVVPCVAMSIAWVQTPNAGSEWIPWRLILFRLENRGPKQGTVLYHFSFLVHASHWMS